jgi:hypothetical protein
MAYAYFEPRANGYSPYYHRLVVHTRGLASLVKITIPINYGNFYSVAIHPTANSIYCLNTFGDLYLFPFTPGSLPSTIPVMSTSTPTSIYLNLYEKYATIDVVDSTTPVFKTPETLSFFSLTTNTFTFHFNRKPTTSRSIPGTNNLFLIYHNWQVKLYNTDTHSVDTTFTPLTGSIKEISVSGSASPPKIYVLYADKIVMYSYSPATPNVFTLVTTKTSAQVLTDISAVATYIIGVDQFLDTEVMLLSPYDLLLLMNIKINVAPASWVAMVILSESTLSMVANSLSQLTSTLPLFTISTTIDTTTGKSKVYTYGNDLYYVTDWSTTWGTVYYSDILVNYPSTYWPLMAQLHPMKMSHLTKQTPRYSAAAIETIGGITFAEQLFAIARDNTPSQRDTTRIGNLRNYRHCVMDHARGNLTRVPFAVYPYGAVYYSLAEAGGLRFSEIYSAFIMGAIPYQIANNSIFVTDGDNNLYQFSFTECYHNTTILNFQTIIAQCAVSNCLYCNFFNIMDCRECKSGYNVTSTGHMHSILHELGSDRDDMRTQLSHRDIQAPLHIS